MRELDVQLLRENVVKVVAMYPLGRRIQEMANAERIMALNNFCFKEEGSSIIFWQQIRGFIGRLHNDVIRLRFKVEPETMDFLREATIFFEKKEKGLIEDVITIAREMTRQNQENAKKCASK